MSIIEFLDILHNASLSVNLDELDVSVKKNVRTIKEHTKLRQVCSELKKGFSEKNDDFDQGRIIKKLYKVLTQHINKIYPEKSNDLFTLKNEKNETITIIPGLDINLVIHLLNNDDMNYLWGYLYMMYVCSVSMISLINNHKKNEKILELLPKIKEKVVKSGVMNKNQKLYNPFIGLIGQTDTVAQYDVKTMFETVEGIKSPEDMTMEAMLKATGIDKLIDPNTINPTVLSEQLKGIGQDDINEATSSIATLLGADGDDDVSDICGTLVSGIVSNMKENPSKGITDMFGTAKGVVDKLGHTLDQNKMKKTASKVFNFFKEGKNNLKNMKDKDGLPIGEKIYSALAEPLKKIEEMTEKNPNQPLDIKDFIGEATKLMAQNNDNNKQKK